MWMLRRVIIDSKYFSDKDKRKIRGNIDKIHKVELGMLDILALRPHMKLGNVIYLNVHSVKRLQ